MLDEFPRDMKDTAKKPQQTIYSKQIQTVRS